MTETNQSIAKQKIRPLAWILLALAVAAIVGGTLLATKNLNPTTTVTVEQPG